MSQNLSQTFLAITRNDTDLEWLQGALAPLGQVVSAGGGSLDELLALVDVTFASLVFVGLDRDHLVAQSALIEGVLEAKPMLAIVALGDGMDNQLVLNAMRAGARDFVAYGSRSSEVAGLVRRLSKRLPAVTPSTQLGGLTVLYGVQSNADGALLANHMALVVQKSGQQTLLLDLGLPRGDSLALLGLESSFHFGDALRHLRRLDTTLIDSAFTSAEAGLHLAISRYEMERLAEEIVDELTGFGPLEVLLRDSAVTEILVNGPHRVFIERDGVLHLSDLRFIDAHHVERVMQRILGPLGRRLDESSPMVDARLPDGSRVNAIIPPIALDGPCLSIRKFRKDMLKSTDLMAMQTIDQAIFDFIQEAVSKRCNILISGGTGTGKTTLLNILSQLINPNERLVTIEDVAELQLGHPHVVRLETRPPNAEGHGEVKASDLIRNALRMRPDRIILGEIRGVEVVDVLTAMNTGHDGSMSTVHANNAQDALLRLETLVGLTGRTIAERTLRQMICAALDVVIQLTRMPDGRRCVSEVVEVVGVRDDVYVTNTLFRLDRRTGFGFMREAVNPAGDKLRREPMLAH